MDNNKLKNIIELSKKTNEKYKDKVFRKTNKIISDCKRKKKKTLKIFSNHIKELSKNPDDTTLHKVKVINKKYEKEIEYLDDIINGISDNNYSDEIDKYSNITSFEEINNNLNKENFIDFYSN